MDEQKKVEKEKIYKQGDITRFVNSEGGEYYKKFLNEKKYEKEDFEKKSIQDKGTELKLFFDSNGWKRTANRQNKDSISVGSKDDDKNLISKILNSDKCNNDKKVELMKKAQNLENKENDLTKLQAEINMIRADIKAII